eukprot:PhM_4_TR13125/c0_g1_i1/m.20325
MAANNNSTNDVIINPGHPTITSLTQSVHTIFRVGVQHEHHQQHRKGTLTLFCHEDEQRQRKPHVLFEQRSSPRSCSSCYCMIQQYCKMDSYFDPSHVRSEATLFQCTSHVARICDDFKTDILGGHEGLDLLCSLIPFVEDRLRMVRAEFVAQGTHGRAYVKALFTMLRVHTTLWHWTHRVRPSSTSRRCVSEPQPRHQSNLTLSQLENVLRTLMCELKLLGSEDNDDDDGNRFDFDFVQSVVIASLLLLSLGHNVETSSSWWSGPSDGFFTQLHALVHTFSIFQSNKSATGGALLLADVLAYIGDFMSGRYAKCIDTIHSKTTEYNNEQCADGDMFTADSMVLVDRYLPWLIAEQHMTFLRIRLASDLFVARAAGGNVPRVVGEVPVSYVASGLLKSSLLLDLVEGVELVEIEGESESKGVSFGSLGNIVLLCPRWDLVDA